MSTVYTITRSIVSKQDDKDKVTKELVCILDFTSTASSDLRIVNYDLEFLTLELDKIIIRFEKLFNSYTHIVGYDKTFEEYIREGSDNLDDELIPIYFEKLNKLKDLQLDKEIRNLKFNLKKVIDAYQEYEIFIRQGLAYYEKFENIIENLAPNCPETDVAKDIKAKYDTMKLKLENAKTDFKRTYDKNIKQTYIKNLIEG